MLLHMAWRALLIVAVSLCVLLSVLSGATAEPRTRTRVRSTGGAAAVVARTVFDRPEAETTVPLVSRLHPSDFVVAVTLNDPAGTWSGSYRGLFDFGTSAAANTIEAYLNGSLVVDVYDSAGAYRRWQPDRGFSGPATKQIAIGWERGAWHVRSGRIDIPGTWSGPGTGTISAVPAGVVRVGDIISETYPFVGTASEICQGPARKCLQADVAQYIDCRGDSITRGAGSTDPATADPPHVGTTSYPALLAANLGASWSVVNNGNSGWRADETRPYFATVDALQGFGWNFFLLGVNDCIQGRAPADIYADIIAMYDEATALGSRAYIITILPECTFGGAPAKVCLEAVNALLLSSGRNVIDAHAVFTGEDGCLAPRFIDEGGDGLHPNDLGHETLYSLARSVLPNPPDAGQPPDAAAPGVDAGSGVVLARSTWSAEAAPKTVSVAVTDPDNLFVSVTVTPTGAWADTTYRGLIEFGASGPNAFQLYTAGGGMLWDVYDSSNAYRRWTSAGQLSAGAHTIGVGWVAGTATILVDGSPASGSWSGPGTGAVSAIVPSSLSAGGITGYPLVGTISQALQCSASTGCE